MLLVIDAQPDFKAARRILPAIAKQIKIAKRNRELIVFLEYSGHSETYGELTELIKNYHKFIRVKKLGDNGAAECLDSAFYQGYNIRRHREIKIVGCNISFCVKATVLSLAEYLPNNVITIISEACNCVYNKKFTWTKKYSNIEVI